MHTISSFAHLDLFHPTAKGPVDIGGTREVLTGTIVVDGVGLTVGYTEFTKLHRAALGKVPRVKSTHAFAAEMNGFAGAAFVETRCRFRLEWRGALKCDEGAVVVFRVEVGSAGELVVGITRSVHGRVVTTRHRLRRELALADACDPDAVVSNLVPFVPMERHGPRSIP